MSNKTKFPGVFGNDVPESTLCLKYSLSLLNQDSGQLLFTTIKLVYGVYTGEVEVRQREALLEYIVQEIESAKYDPAALLVFIHFDPDPEIIRRAVSGYLVRRLGSIDDPFIATQDILTILSKHDVANRGAVFAALVCFGDRRICSAARAIRDSITQAEAREFAKATTNPLYLATAEFCITWLVDLNNQGKYEVLIPVAAALSSMLISEPTGSIRDHQFNFGPYGFTSIESLPEVEIRNLVIDMAPLLDLLSKSGVSELNEMIEMLRDLPYTTLPNVIEQNQAPTRRGSQDRRVNDRRVAAILPPLERRTWQRRSADRSVADRREILSR